jgi:uncharacterized protein
MGRRTSCAASCSASGALARRALLSLGGWLGSGALVSAGCDQEDEDRDLGASELWLAAHGAEPGEFGLVVASPREVLSVVATGFRGHDVSPRPHHPGRVALFGRRPGRLAVEIDLEAGRVVRRLELPEARALQGHGFFTPDGAHLVTSEMDVASGRGVLAVRDAETLELVSELDSFGIGPHEIALMPDQRTIVVANGGILTHPETGDDPLNLETMRSSLAYVDLNSGELVHEELFPEPKASLRHLDVCDDGTVLVAAQVQREAMSGTDVVPLVAVHRPGEALRALDAGLEVIAAMDDYAGSVAVDGITRVVGATSPRGNLAVFWDIDSGALLGQIELFDVCGIALSVEAGAFVLSGGNEQVLRLDAETLAPVAGRLGPYGGVRWDNHLICLPPWSRS